MARKLLGKKQRALTFSENFAAYMGTKLRSESDSTRKLDRAGYVYVLKGRDGIYKIGRARDPQDRLRTFEVKLPFLVEFELLIKTDDMYKLERELHVRFGEQNVNGEWFQLTDSDLAEIKERQQQVLGDDEV